MDERFLGKGYSHRVDVSRYSLLATCEKGKSAFTRERSGSNHFRKGIEVGYKLTWGALGVTEGEGHNIAPGGIFVERL